MRPNRTSPIPRPRMIEIIYAPLKVLYVLTLKSRTRTEINHTYMTANIRAYEKVDCMT